MIEASRMMEYLYQITFSFRRNGSMLPNENITYEYFNIKNGIQLSIVYNPTEILLDASFCCMAFNHLVCRKVLKTSELVTLERLAVLTQLCVHRLFILKQLMAQSTSGSYVIKNHLIGHLGTFIRLNGHSGITNVDKTESAHVNIKEDFGHSSKHLGNFKELIQMNRIKKITKQLMNNMQKGKRSDDDNNDSINNETTHTNTTFIPNLGYVDVKIIQVGRNQYEWRPIFNGTSLLPVHVLLGINGLKQLFMSNLNDPNKAMVEGWKAIGEDCLKGVSKCSLLKGVKLTFNNEEYIIYAKRDHIVKSAPGINSGNIMRDRFNFVEVSF